MENSLPSHLMSTCDKVAGFFKYSLGVRVNSKGGGL